MINNLSQLNLLQTQTIIKMCNPANSKPSTQVLKDLLQIREKLLKIESSTKPFVSKLDPLIKEDKLLSECLLRYLAYELNYRINFRPELNDMNDPEEEMF